jgi:predicted ester cyclase
LPAGEAGIRQLFDSFGRIQQKWTIDDVIVQDQKVVVRATCTVEQDSFLGVPAAGRQQVFTATFIHDVVAGRITRTRRNADDLGRLLQLGARVVPGAPAPGH